MCAPVWVFQLSFLQAPPKALFSSRCPGYREGWSSALCGCDQVVILCYPHHRWVHGFSGKTRAHFWNWAILESVSINQASLVIPSPILSGAQPWTFAAERDSSKKAINHSAETTVPAGKLLAGNGLVERTSPAEPSWKECSGAVGKVAEPAGGRVQSSSTSTCAAWLLFRQSNLQGVFFSPRSLLFWAVELPCHITFVPLSRCMQEWCPYCLCLGKLHGHVLQGTFTTLFLFLVVNTFLW